MNEPLLTPSDVAARLNISLRAVYDLLAPGGALYDLRVEIGHKTIRVRPAALDQFVASGGLRSAANR